MHYSYADNDGVKSLTLLFFETDKDPVIINPTHPEWDALYEGAATMSEEEALELLVKDHPSSAWLGKVSDNVEVTLYGVMYNGESISGEVADAIVAIAGDPDRSEEEISDHLKALARFLEKADSNPSIENSDDLYKWIVAEKLTIAPDGDVIGYKSVISTEPGHEFKVAGKNFAFPEDMTVYRSSFAGGGIVDGIKFTGYVPNYVGARVEMERDKVNPDGSTYCSTGMHVGTWNYANYEYNMGNVVLVKFSPSDVVSVPKDYSFQKLRTCGYTVIKDNVTSLLDENLYVDDVFAPNVDDNSEASFETVRDILDRLRKSVV